MIEVWETPIMSNVNDILVHLRDELNVEGVNLLNDIKPTHNNIMCTCIAHGNGQERHPSCGVSTKDQKVNGQFFPAGTVHCFTCGYKADLPTFISDCFGKGDKGYFGFKWLTSNFVNLAVENRKPLEINISREMDLEEDITTYVSEIELEQYRYIHPYMYERKLTDKVINYFDVGFDKSTNSLTFPVHDLNGEVLFVQRRAVSGKSFNNETNVQRGVMVYGLYQVYQNLSWIEEVIICESIIDALTCWTHRKPAVAILSARPTSNQIRLLKELPVKKYIEGLDNDEAGRKGANLLKKELGNTKLLYKMNWLEGVKDWNDLSTKDFNNLQFTII